MAVATDPSTKQAKKDATAPMVAALLDGHGFRRLGEALIS